MRKKVVILVFVFLFAALAGLVVFLKIQRDNNLADPYKAISPKVAIVIETSDVQSFLNKLTSPAGMIGELAGIKEFAPFYQKLSFLADQFNKPAYKPFIEYNTVLFSFRPFADDKVETLMSIGVRPTMKLHDLKNVLSDSLITNIIERDVAEYTALVLPYNVNGLTDSAYVALNAGLLVASTSVELLREAYLQAPTGIDVRDLPGFRNVLQASGAKEDKLFVAYQNLPDILKKLFADNQSIFAERASSLASSSGMDIFLNDNSLIISGYTESVAESDKLYNFKTNASGTLQSFSILPASTGFFETFVPEVIINYPTNNTVDKRVVDLASKLREYIDGEITKAYIDIKGRPVDENKLVVYKLKDRVYAEKLFVDEFNKLGDDGNVIVYKPDDALEIPVYLTPYKGFGKAMAPGYMWNIDDSYFTFYDNYLITGSSYVTVNRLLYDNILNKTLANDLMYKDFERTMPSVSGCFLYMVPSRITAYISQFMSSSANDFIKNNKTAIDKLPAVGVSLVSSNNMIYNNISLQYKEEAVYESVTEWETLLDTVAAIKPFFFTNHSTGAKEIFIQDLRNNIYLINAAGRVLWKVPLRERINGSVYMVDVYKNNRYQLLFAGREYLHVIDRNGNYVDRYPVKLRSPATNSLALFDYDNNKNYRMIIAGEDKQVYAYDKTGSVVKGWKVFKTNSEVYGEISWFRVSGKDYLVVSDNTSLYFLDRTGNKRLTLKNPVSKANGSAVRLVTGSQPSVVCTSKEGEIQHIYLDGSVKKYNVGNFSADHSFDIFDITGDGVNEYVIIDKGILYLFDSNRKEMFSRQLGAEKLEGPISFTFSANDRKIGVYDPGDKLIYLVDRNGDVIDGFPLKGASLFSIGRLADKNKWNLIVGGTDRFLYNYKIDIQ